MAGAPYPAPALYREYTWLSRGLLPVTLLKEMEWCPVIPWLAVNRGLEPPPTPSMAEGVRAHREGLAERVARALGYRRPRLNVHLESRELGLYGTLDILAPEEREVAEAKHAVSRPGRHHRVQLLAYAALATLNGTPVRTARLATPRRQVMAVPVDQYALRAVEDRAARLHEVVENPDPPPVNPDPAKCSYCRYRRQCPYRATR